MTSTGLPFRTAEAITPETATEALRRAGLLTEAVAVSDVRVSPIGTGQMADSLRLSFTYGVGSEPGPPSVVVKLPSSDERSRITGRIMRAYEVEVGFYTDIAPTIEIRTPACFLAAIDLDTHDFVLLLEDLAPAVQGDQLDGCDIDLVTRVLDQAAALHAPRWNDPSLGDVEWLARSSPESAAATAAIVGSLYPGFLERYGDSLAPEIIAGLDRAVERIGDWWQGLPGARTILHGDFRLDNLLLGDGPGDIWTVDWQTVVLGNGIADAAYFVGGNLPADVRRSHEDDLVRHYHQALIDRGVSDLSWDECWARYRHGAWHGVYLCIAASMLVEQTERGDRMFINNTEHHVQHALDLDAFDAFDLADTDLFMSRETGRG